MRLSGIRLTDHFTAGEFACQGGSCCCHGAILVDPDLVLFLEEFRMETGTPLRVTSGFRCDDHNRKVGGHLASFHRIGSAADVTSFRLREGLESWAIKAGAMLEARIGPERGNVIFYPGRQFIHCDVGHRIAELVRKKG